MAFRSASRCSRLRPTPRRAQTCSDTGRLPPDISRKAGTSTIFSFDLAAREYPENQLLESCNPGPVCRWAPRIRPHRRSELSVNTLEPAPSLHFAPGFHRNSRVCFYAGAEELFNKALCMTMYELHIIFSFVKRLFFATCALLQQRCLGSQVSLIKASLRTVHAQIAHVVPGCTSG